jgi:ribosomal protein S18 acetylase RimI-like enzyme
VVDEAVTLRRAGPADAAAVRQLTREAYAKWVPRIGREPLPMTADYDVAVRDHRVDLLYLAGELAALIVMVDQGDRLLIENLAVAPGHQRRGLGTRLLAHAEAVTAALGHERIWLYTNTRFDGNIALYSRVGYRIDSEEDIGGGLIRVNMSKALTPAMR